VLLLLHGNPDNADEWQPLIERLADRYSCLAPDFPGYGESPEPPPTFTHRLADQVKFVDAVLTAVHASGPVLLVVHDTGGCSPVADARTTQSGLLPGLIRRWIWAKLVSATISDQPRDDESAIPIRGPDPRVRRLRM
jgi:haloalkane dehalogenase